LKLSLFIASLFLAGASSTFAQSGGNILDTKDVPETVKQQVDCGTEANDVTRRPIAGGFAFAWRCPGNHANSMQALVFATDKDGADARLLKFPTPQRKIHTEISNIRWFPNTNEVSQIFVDPETRICRIESRWRITGKNAGKHAEPVLTHWRQTRDCRGRRGWVTLVNRK
jgi:hypothetical protein